MRVCMCKRTLLLRKSARSSNLIKNFTCLLGVAVPRTFFPLRLYLRFPTPPAPLFFAAEVVIGGAGASSGLGVWDKSIFGLAGEGLGEKLLLLLSLILLLPFGVARTPRPRLFFFPELRGVLEEVAGVFERLIERSDRPWDGLIDISEPDGEAFARGAGIFSLSTGSLMRGIVGSELRKESWRRGEDFLTTTTTRMQSGPI